MQPVVVSKTWTGDGAAKNVELGFSPTFAKIFNATDQIDFFYHPALADLSLNMTQQRAQNGDSSSTASIVAYAGTSTTSKGVTFIAGANVNAKKFVGIFFR